MRGTPAVALESRLLPIYSNTGALEQKLFTNCVTSWLSNLAELPHTHAHLCMGSGRNASKSFAMT